MSTRTCIIVEDSPTFSAILSRLYMQMGYDCIPLRNGATLLAVYEANQPAFVSMDISLMGSDTGLSLNQKHK